MNDNVISNMERSLAAMKDYQAVRKKLESRRLTYDSALSKVQKARKEDAKLDEELRAAKARYEESNDLAHQRMSSIRAAESNSLEDISGFIEAEADYFASAHDILSQLCKSFRATIQYEPKPHSSRDICQPPRSTILKSQGDHNAGCHSMRDINLARRSASCNETHQDPYMPRYNADDPAPGLTMITSERSLSQNSLVNSVTSPSEQNDSRPVSMHRFNSAPAIPRNVKRQVRADFSFDAEADTEMSIQTGDIIEVLDELSEG